MRTKSTTAVTWEVNMRGKQILWTAVVALAVVMGVKVYEAKRG